jgi:hypothetical protein
MGFLYLHQREGAIVNGTQSIGGAHFGPVALEAHIASQAEVVDVVVGGDCPVMAVS